VPFHIKLLSPYCQVDVFYIMLNDKVMVLVLVDINSFKFTFCQ